VKARTPFASFQKSYSGGIAYQFSKRVHFLSSVTAFAEMMYNQISLSLQTAENRVWIDLKYPQLRLWWCHWQGRQRSGTTGDAVKELSAMETHKNKNKNRYQLCLFLFSSNVDLKNKNKHRKPFWMYLGARIAAIIFFKSLRKERNDPWYYYEKVPM